MKPLCWSSVLLLLVAFGCDPLAESGGEPVDFGDDYWVVTQLPAPDGEPSDVTPQLAKNQVGVTVQFPGGCREHTFHLQTRRQADVVELWYVHDAGDDACEAVITQALSEALPDDVPEEGRLVLLTPRGSRFDLR